MLFTDTYSLTYEIKSEDVYEEFFEHKHLFDLSNYPKDSKFFDPTNKKVVGKIRLFEGKKSWVCWIKVKNAFYEKESNDGKESNTAKGVNIATEFNEFKDIYLTKKYSDTKWKQKVFWW